MIAKVVLVDAIKAENKDNYYRGAIVFRPEKTHIPLYPPMFTGHIWF